jgi:serine protease Do/2-alkenal reductase
MKFCTAPRAAMLLFRAPLALLICGAAAWLICGSAAWAAPPMSPDLADLASRVMPAVVSIASTDPVTSNAAGGDDGDGGDSGSAYHAADVPGTVLPPPKAQEALGSGFVFDAAGYILTNNHVINGATSVTVTFQDGTILPAVVVGKDGAADLAVLKVAADHKLPFVTFGDSGKLRVGDWVMAIGNPFGLPGSTSAGIVSALDRNISENTYDDFIQTDATINRGNSGGPLFDMNGNVIGVNSAIYSPSGGSVGIGFAIPSAMAAPVAQALKTNGAMVRGWLGAATQEVTPAVQSALGLPAANGALVGAVSTGSPSDGVLKPGDVLTALAGVAIKNSRGLMIRTAEIPAGAKVPVTFWRDGAAQQAVLRITVPPAAVNDSVPAPAAKLPGNVTLANLGLAVSTKPAPAGVAITAVTAGGPSANAGIVAGDIVEQVAGETIASTKDLQSRVAALVAAKLPVAVLLVTGDLATGENPGPRWVPVPFKK